MINAVNEQFSRFVSFAQERFDAGKETAIATKGDVQANGGTPLEERGITVTDKSDWVGKSLFRKQDAKIANNEVRDLFRKCVADMFGGERNIPDSVKTAMLMKDYGCGKPLTARRILAVRDAIANLGRADCFDKTNDPKGELANKAIAAGYTRKDFGRLNTAANLLSTTKSMTLTEALEQVITRGSAANRTMKAGAIYMKNAESFSEGYNFHSIGAADDARNRELAAQNAGEDSTDNLAPIAKNLQLKFKDLLHDAELLLEAAKPSKENENVLDELRTSLDNLSKQFGDLSKSLYDCTLKDRSKIYKQMLDSEGVIAIDQLVMQVNMRLKDEAAQNPAIADLRRYLIGLVHDVRAEYDVLSKTYKEAVGKDMYPVACDMLKNAAELGEVRTKKPVSIPKGITDDLEAALKKTPFTTMSNLKKLCRYLENNGDAALRFSDAHKADLKELFQKVFGDGPKAEKAFARMVGKFETSFFAEFLINANGPDKKSPRPDFVVNHFKANPETLAAFDPGFDLAGDNAVEELKSAIKNQMLADIKKPLADTEDKKITSLSSGMMPQAVREYGAGYVTFNGQNIPNAQLGKTFPFGEANNPERKGYAEFLETTFDDNHKKMRQMVSFTCGMALGFAGAIDELLEHGGDNSHVKGMPRAESTAKGTQVIPADRVPEENYNIEIAENGDVKISLNHIVRNKMTYLFSDDDIYAPHDISRDVAPIVGEVKITATMTIKNAADAELGNGMPEFTIDDIRQEEI